MASTLRATFAMAIATLALAAAPSAAVAQDPTPTPTPTPTPEPQHLTARGVLLSVQDDLQPLQQTNPDGTVTHCQVAGGTLRTQSGDLNFGVGGVVTPSGTLAPPVQEAYRTLLDSERRGSSVITTVNFDSPGSICGYPGNVVTSVSLEEVAPPAPAPPPAGPPPAPPQTTQTVSGIVTRVSPFGQLVSNGQSNCKVWPSTIRTTSGQELNFAVHTPLSGSLAGGGLNPTDPNAAPRAQLIETAFLRKAFTTITITGPVNACGLNLPAVVTDVNVQLPPLKNSTKKGRVLRISSGSNFSGSGESCKAWNGVLKTTSGKRIKFSVVTKTQNGQAVSAGALKIAEALKKARTKGKWVQATITYQAGSVNACGRKFTNPVNKAKVKTKRPQQR